MTRTGKRNSGGGAPSSRHRELGRHHGCEARPAGSRHRVGRTVSCCDGYRERARQGWVAIWRRVAIPGSGTTRVRPQRDSPARERIVASLVLEYLEGVFGSREHLIALSATYRACELAGLDPATLFEQVAGALMGRWRFITSIRQTASQGLTHRGEQKPRGCY